MSYSHPIIFDLDDLRILLYYASLAAWLHTTHPSTLDEDEDDREDCLTHNTHGRFSRSVSFYYEYPPSGKQLNVDLDAFAPLIIDEQSPVPSQPPIEGPPPNKKTPYLQRFIGNTYIARIIRAAYQTGVSWGERHEYLSPWGDNNPVTLPNLRTRDVVIAAVLTVTTILFPPLAPLHITPHAVQHLVQLPGEILVEQVLDEAIDIVSMLTPRAPRIKTRPGGYNATFRLKHALMGMRADISFIGETQNHDQGSCSKGWLCPYLYASGRTPLIARDRNFEIAQFNGPAIPGEEIAYRT